MSTALDTPEWRVRESPLHQVRAGTTGRRTGGPSCISRHDADLWTRLLRELLLHVLRRREMGNEIRRDLLLERFELGVLRGRE